MHGEAAKSLTLKENLCPLLTLDILLNQAEVAKLQSCAFQSLCWAHCFREKSCVQDHNPSLQLRVCLQSVPSMQLCTFLCSRPVAFSTCPPAQLSQLPSKPPMWHSREEGALAAVLILLKLIHKRADKPEGRESFFLGEFVYCTEFSANKNTGSFDLELG